MKNITQTTSQAVGVQAVRNLVSFRKQLHEQVRLGIIRATYIEARFNAYKRALKIQILKAN